MSTRTQPSSLPHPLSGPRILCLDAEGHPNLVQPPVADLRPLWVPAPRTTTASLISQHRSADLVPACNSALAQNTIRFQVGMVEVLAGASPGVSAGFSERHSDTVRRRQVSQAVHQSRAGDFPQ
jgi:hypothetical protein